MIPMMSSCRHQGLLKVALISALFVMTLFASCHGVPNITLEQAGSKWYAGIEHSVYVCVKDEAAITEVVLTYGISGQSPFEPIEMAPFADSSLSDACAYYRATIPSERVRHGLYLEVNVQNENDETATLRTHPVIRFFPFQDADPALNVEAFGADVSRVSNIPMVFLGPASGEPTDFGYRTPGFFWVPVELSGFGQYAVLAKLCERGERQSIYEGVLTHLFVQDGLGDRTLSHESADQDILDEISMTAEAGGLVFEQWNVLVESFGVTRRLTRSEMEAWQQFLGSQMHYTGMQAKWARMYESFGTVSRILDIVNLTGDGLRVVFLMQLMNDAALERLELFARTYLTRPDIDPALVDAVEAVRDDLETFDGKLIRAIQETTDVVGWGAVAIRALLPKMAAIGSLKFALAGAAVQLFWDDVVEELGLLRRLVVAATLEKTITDSPADEPILGHDALGLAQMKFYLGFYYSDLFLSLRNKVTLALADLISGGHMEDSYDRLEAVNMYCAARYAEYASLLAFTSSMPQGSLTLQEAADQGLIELESKGGYAGDTVTLIATGENEDDVTVVSRPGDVLLVKGEQGLKQSLVISKYDTTLIRGDTPPGTVLKRGLYTFCINADGSGLHERDRFDVTLNLEDWPYKSAQQLVMLLTLIDQAARHEDSSAQHAIWTITNGDRPDSESEALLRQAGILSASFLDAFPTSLTNPASGSPDTTFVMPPELRTCSLFVVALICSLLVVLLTLAGIIVIARSR